MSTPFIQSMSAEDIGRLARQYADQRKPLDIMEDIVFKDVFTGDNEDSREALRLLLSSIIHREVSQVQIMNTEILPEHRGAKTARLDIHAIFDEGKAADLEMQMGLPGDNLKNRAAYYAARLLSGQAERGEPYHQIKRVYQVFFMNSILFPESKKLPRRYFLMEEEEHDKLSEVEEVIFYELPKLEGLVTAYLEGREPEGRLERLSAEEKWCIFFKYQKEERAAKLIRELCREERGIMRAEQALSRVSGDYEKWAQALFREKAELDYYAGLAYARYEGKAEGKAEGLSEGKTEIARKLKGMGLPAENVEAATGLSREDIEKL